MKRSKRLTIVVELAKRQEENAAAIVATRTQELAQEQQRIDELQRYYQEYEASCLSRRSGLRAEDIVSGRNFLLQLSDAISVQANQLSRCENQLDKAKQEWHRLHLKHQNLVELVERIQKQENYALDKQEQKMIDEWVSQNSAHNRVE